MIRRAAAGELDARKAIKVERRKVRECETKKKRLK